MSPPNKQNLETLKSILCASFYDESAWQLVEGPMRQTYSRGGPGLYVSAQVKRAIIGFLRRRGLLLVRPHPYNPEQRENGQDWPLFGYTMIGRKRLSNIQECIEKILKDDVPGDLMETGVWRGGAVIFMKAVLAEYGDSKRRVWCADSFEGLPPPNAKDQSLSKVSDLSDVGFLAVSQEQVEANFSRFGLLDDRVMFLKGWFRDTLPASPVERLALLRLDGDLYESTMDALTNLYQKISPGGYLIIDDYGSWAGCRQAVDDYREANGISAEIQRIDQAAICWRVPGKLSAVS